MVQLVKTHMLSNCKSCKCDKTGVMVIDLGLGKTVGFPLGMGNSSRGGNRGRGRGPLVIRRRIGTPKRLQDRNGYPRKHGSWHYFMPSPESHEHR